MPEELLPYLEYYVAADGSYVEFCQILECRPSPELLAIFNGIAVAQKIAEKKNMNALKAHGKY